MLALHVAVVGLPVWTAPFPGGGGGGSSVLDTNYPPTGRWPKAPWGGGGGFGVGGF